ncbi:MAG: PEP-CTERM sorting domain-containing protein [Ectothiorhodospiraceae bacterium]|nr:PEP-CTERM sorting domain-containing protein [Ectothiorhodospiraceae bacterium]
MSYDSLTSSLVTEAVTLAAGSFNSGQWEHVTFARAGILEIPLVITPIPEPATLTLLNLGLMGIGFAQRKNIYF